MVLVDTAWSSRASGIARDAEAAARLRQIANAEATSSFTGFSLPFNLPQGGGFATYAKSFGALPVTAMPAAPVTAVPAAMPAPMPAMPVPVPVMSPAHFFGLDSVHIVLRDHRRFRAFAARRSQTLRRRNRRQRRRIRAGSKRCSTSGKSNGDFQKVAAFHDIFLLVHDE
jgi:hypothetical protein